MRRQFGLGRRQLVRLWLYGDAVFTDEDVEQTWRFIVKKMPHVLRAL